MVAKILTMLLMILTLESCKTGVDQRLACNEIKRYQIKPLLKCTPSWTKNRCRCRCFDWNNWATLRLNQCKEFQDYQGTETALNFELKRCEGVDGSFLGDEADFMRPNVQALAETRDNLCQ